ncbi:MAG TPA: hypothetical protein VGS57_09265 [Thermoanaerobaculia bacterium]|nr:hypothetical protein [Thermoanaerobaculia bacterium]
MFDIELDGLGFELDDGLFTTKLSGKLTPLFGADQGLKWPSFDVKELSIDSKGNVHLDGGWLSLPQQQTLDFYGFKIEISQLGFGKTDDGGKWIGFSGGLKLVEGLQAGASVEGLRITWYEDGRLPRISLNGAGVELKIPDVLELKGEVSFKEIDGEAPGEKIRRFDGDIKLKLHTPNLEIDGTLVIGSVKGPQGRYNFFAFYADAELPTGLPLASTGVAIYGFAGLLALQMEPAKLASEAWFSIDHGKSFYHRGKPGITDIKTKWKPQKGSFALGAGITLGTLSDNGYTFNGKFLLAIVIPGPLILLQGAASFLKKRADGADEGQFRALAVLDGRAGSFLIGLDAEYKTGKGGELVEIKGGMEAFYAFHDPTAWHLYLGQKEPRELRIRALLGQFVEANAYFMLDAHELALGAWFGYANGWSFGPLSVKLEAWAEGNARLGFKPTHFHGDLWLHCLLELAVFGFGLGIALDATIAADLFTPYHLLGKFSVGIKLPWPFKKKLGGTVTLEWGPRPLAPPLPLPVKQVAVEHLKSTAVWALPRGQYLLPSWDDGNGFLTAAAPWTEPDLSKVPLVPLDGRLSLTFDRSVHDKAMVGVNLQQIIPVEPIGSPGSPSVNVRYVLASLELRRWNGAGGWELVASSPKSAGVPALFGAWSIVPRLPAVGAPVVGQTKLLCGVLTPFDFNRSTGPAMEEWASDALPGYPCIPLAAAEETCIDFARFEPGTRVESPLTLSGRPAFTLSWGFGPATVETREVPATTGSATARGEKQRVRTLCFPVEATRRGIHVQSSEPGRSFRLVFAPSAAPAPVSAASRALLPGGAGDETKATICVDLRRRTAGTVANPWRIEGVRFTVRGADGAPLTLGRLERWGSSPLGLGAGYQLDIELPCLSPWVELTVTHRPPFRIVAFDAAGAAVAIHAPQGTAGELTETIRLEGRDIARLSVYAAGNEKLVHAVCWRCPPDHGTSATGHGENGQLYGPFLLTPDGVLVVDGAGVTTVDVTGEGPLCLWRLCVTPDPEAGQLVRRDEVIQHVREELARWHSEGELLAPHTAYKLTIRTQVEPDPFISGMPNDRSPVEHAYFRTGGPPGLTALDVPVGTDSSKPFVTGLEDLSRYVDETDPPTVPPPGEKPILFKPFYRAYDVGVQFNESYVEQMYRMDGRDLGLYLFDNSNQPVRDAHGRLLALAPRWDRVETVTLSERETRWLTMIDAATCLATKLAPQSFPHDRTLVSTEARVLAPDKLHEARLVPLLLHESFTAGAAGGPPRGWFADDAGPGGPSLWLVGEVGEPASRFVEQGSAVGGAAEPARHGTVLLLADAAAAEWTDYRLSVHVRAVAGGAVGLVFRYGGPGTWYRFALQQRGRRLVKSGAQGIAVLAEDHVAYRRNREYLLTVEAVGPSLRAYVDGEPVFAVEDAELAKGRVGLYVCESPGARFADVRVDDFRPAAPVVYRFQLTTSLYANFFHHLHGFEDHAWSGALEAGAESALAQAVPFTFAAPNEAETRAYEAVADAALGPAARQNPLRVEVTRLTRTGGPPCLLLRAPEPLGWGRVEIALSRPAHRLPPPLPPGDVKLTGVAFTSGSEGESVSLLLREGMELTRHRVELRQLPGPVSEPAGDPVVLLESFRDEGALARFDIVDEGSGGPSQWRIEGGALIQLSAIGGGAEPALPGTQALTGDGDWTNYRLSVDLRSDAGGSIGIVFRWRDAANHYRLAADATLPYRRLVKVEAGVVSVLWEDQGSYAPGEPFELVVEAFGSRLTAYLDGVRLCELVDTAHAAGRVGLYACNDPTARFERLEVRRLSLEALALLRDRFATGDLAAWSLLSEVTGVPLAGAAAWETMDGALRLQSLLAAGGNPDYPGAYALAGDPGWTDVLLRVRVRSHGGAVGVVFRAQSTASYYRFAMSRERGARQLVKRSGGTTKVLWQDDVVYEADRSYELTIAAIGSSLRGWLDGVPTFVVDDGELTAGRIGLYAWSNIDAWFSEVRVWPAELAFAAWSFEEPFLALDPARWSFEDETGAVAAAPWKVEDGTLRCEPEPATWEAAGGGLNGNVLAVADGGGEVFAGGNFTVAGGGRGVAVWDGNAWHALGAGVNGTVRALAVDGDSVYVGGSFTQAGGAPAQNVAVWRRSTNTWSALGTGVAGAVRALAVDGGRVYAGGLFASAGGVAATNLAAWVKSAHAWEAVGGGVDGAVLALAEDTGFLYVGGAFANAGGKPASRVARWDGKNWVAAGGTIDGTVSALAVGPEGLFIAGAFTHAGGVAASRVARWTGTAWAPLGAGLDAPVFALALDGNQLWAGGHFQHAGGAAASRLARWDRAAGTWSALGQGVDNDVLALARAGDRLWAGGAFASAGGVAVHGVAALALGGARFAVLSEPLPDRFRLELRLVPGGEGAAAVLLAWQDHLNHLALWLDAEHGSRRLLRVVNGVSSVLWSDAVAPRPGREYALTIDSWGDRLAGFLDGAELFDLDAGPSAGRLALALRRSPAARVRDLRWAAPEWTCWHAFGEEEWLAAGTRVRIQARPNAAAAAAGLVLRSAALAGDSGTARFDPHGVELRLAAPDGSAGHARAFLPPTAYAAIGFDALRKADGTGVVLIPKVSEGAAGPLRLELTFHRDRADAGRTFSQAGDRSAERVTLDVP